LVKRTNICGEDQTLISDDEKNIIYLVAIEGNKIYVNYSLDNGETFNNENTFRFSTLNSNTLTPVLLEDETLMIPFSTFGRNAIGGSRRNGKYEVLKQALNWLNPFSIEKGFGTPLFLSEVCQTGFPVLAIDNKSKKFKGNMYYTCSSQTNNSIIVHYSDTDGKSWSAGDAIAVYSKKERSKRNPFTGIPQVTVNKDGVVGVIWQDRTEDPKDKCQYLYFSASLDGGKTFLKPKRVSSELSCMGNEENDWAGQRYKSGGDYTGFIADEKEDFIAIWPDSRNGISQLYMATIKVEK